MPAHPYRRETEQPKQADPKGRSCCLTASTVTTVTGRAEHALLTQSASVNSEVTPRSLSPTPAEHHSRAKEAVRRESPGESPVNL